MPLRLLGWGGILSFTGTQEGNIMAWTLTLPADVQSQDPAGKSPFWSHYSVFARPHYLFIDANGVVTVTPEPENEQFVTAAHVIGGGHVLPDPFPNFLAALIQAGGRGDLLTGEDTPVDPVDPVDPTVDPSTGGDVNPGFPLDIIQPFGTVTTATPTASGTSTTPGAIVKIWGGPSGMDVFGEATVALDGTWSVVLTPFTAGTHTVTARDNQGMNNSNSITFTVTL